MCKYLAVITPVSFFLLPIAILLIVSGEKDRDSECQQETRASFYLHEWNFIQGLHDLVLWFALVTVIAIKWWQKGGDLFRLVTIIVFVLDILWLIVLAIIGIAILATNENNSCVAEGKYMAVVAIVSLTVGTPLRAGAFATIGIFLDVD